MNRRGLVFRDGRWVSFSEERIAAAVPGRLRGEGVFETMRARDGRIFLFDRHLRRLRRGAGVLGLPCPLTASGVGRRVGELLRMHPHRDLRVRIVVRRRPRNAGIEVLICVEPYIPLDRDHDRRGWVLASVPEPHPGLSGGTSRVKSLDYHPFRRAWEDAVRRGADEAVLLDRRGGIVEGARTNIFWVRGGVLETPPLSSGCLPGVTRGWVAATARAWGLPLRRRRVPIEVLMEAREVFLTNALVGIVPVTAVDGRRIGTGPRGVWTRRFRRRYRRETRENSQNFMAA